MYSSTVAKHFFKSIEKLKQSQIQFYRSYSNFENPKLSFGEDFAIAKENNLPIVALESTIITHGMPYPDNLTTALEVEDVIRQKVE